MCVRYLLLVCFLGVLNASCMAQSCHAPTLNGGYFVPEQNTYSNQTKLTYACKCGHKPVVKGWWATSTCQDGRWIPEPQCINETACIPPTIPNAEYTSSTNGWYEEGVKIRVTCNNGYELKNKDATAVCVDGTWSSVPVCEKSNHSCGEPPKIPHAVIIGQRHLEMFAVNLEVQYECEDGYTIKGASSTKSVFCILGNWTKLPECSKRNRPTNGHGGSTGTGGGDRYTIDRETSPAGGRSRLAMGLAPTRGYTTFSGSTSLYVAIRRCGSPPVVPDGDFVLSTEWFLRYRCNNFYKLEGPETVLCYNNGSWTQKPTCRAVFCEVNTDQYPQLVSVGNRYLKDGETMEFECVKRKNWWFEHYSVAQCSNGRLSLQKCCSRTEMLLHTC